MIKDYFPTAKAPDIAKKKVMQYIYGSQKNLSKRFYFYKIYAPAFLLLFIVWGGIAFYNREIKPRGEIYTLKTDSGISNNLDQNVETFENAGNQTETSSLINDTSINDNTNTENIATKSIQDNTNQNGGASIIKPDNMTLKTSNTLSSMATPSIASLSSNNVGLDQQINEIENLINDITFITTQEENLF